MYGTLIYMPVNDQVLMVKKSEGGRDPNAGCNTLPGGKLEAHEKGGNPKGRLERAVLECQQETGLTPINPKLRGIILFDNKERNFRSFSNSIDYMVYVFVSTEYTGTMVEKGDGGELPFLAPKTEIPKLHKNAGDNKIYEWLKDGRTFMGIIKHHGEEIDELGTFVEYFQP